MKAIFMGLGIALFTMAAIGAMGWADFDLCFGPVGFCSKAPAK